MRRLGGGHRPRRSRRRPACEVKMGSIVCPAGHAFSDGLIPSPYAWTLISDEKLFRALDEISAMMRAGKDFDEISTFAKKSHGHQAYICPECGRLLVFEDG